MAGAAPSQSNWFVPADARESTGPGTANRSTPRSPASLAVIKLPPRSRLSITTSTSTSAARMRLRSGNRNASGGVPGGHSETTAPRALTSAHSEACCLGYGASGPLPTTANGRASGWASAPRWAAPSMPLARPDTTVTPRADSSKPNSAAVSRPRCVALRVPTMPTRRASSIDRSPRTNSTAGARGSWNNAAGYRGSPWAMTAVPEATQRCQHAAGSRSRPSRRHASASV